MVRKDLAEVVDFLKEIDQTFNGFVDTQLCQLLSTNTEKSFLASEFDKSIKQRFSE